MKPQKPPQTLLVFALFCLLYGLTTLIGRDTVGVAAPLAGVTSRISLASDHTQANNNSYIEQTRALSNDGRYVAFQSEASNLVPGDSNNARDVFVYDRRTAQVVRISVSSTGIQAEGGVSLAATISHDGRYVAFESTAENLVSGDINSYRDIFVHDRDIDGDGIYDEPGSSFTFIVSNAVGGQGYANGSSAFPFISASGRYVAFQSCASNLVNQDINNSCDVFVYDIQAQSTALISVASNGAQADGDSYYRVWPTISADGRFVAFTSYAKNLVANDFNNVLDVFLHDRDTDQDGIFDEAAAIETRRISVHSNGTEGNNESAVASISDDGRYVVYESMATNLIDDDTNRSTDIFVYDRVTQTTRRVSTTATGAQISTSSTYPNISSSGRYITFASISDKLVTGDTNQNVDTFLRDRDTDGDGIFDEPGNVSLTRVSVASSGAQGDQQSPLGSVSPDGSCVAFWSQATTLVAEDTNSKADVFVHDIAGFSWGFKVYLAFAARPH